MASISVVLPSYNEKENVVEIIGCIEKVLSEQLLEIIVVDDNSPDLTWKIVEELQDPKVRLIRRKDEKGLASALADGVQSARGDIVCWLDCDMGLPPQDIPRLVAQLDQYDVAVGSRYVKGGRDNRPLYRRATSIALNGMAFILLSHKFRDYTSGFVAAKRSVVENVKWERKGFGEYFIEFAYRSIQQGYKVTEVPYIFNDRTKGDSKSTASLGKFIKLGWQYTTKILALRKDLFRYVKFVFGGGLSLILNLLVTYLLTEYLHFWHMVSFSIAMGLDVLFLFGYHSLITFRKKGKFPHFAGVILVISGVNWLGVYLLSVVLEVQYLISIITVAGVISVVNYLLNKKLVFRD